MKKAATLIFICLISSSSFSQGSGEPYNPMTANGAEGITVYNHFLNWENPQGTSYNRIYFSEDSSLVANLDTSVIIYDGFLSTAFSTVSLDTVGLLEYYTQYYWRIVEYDSAGFTIGPVWDFRTNTDEDEIFEDDFSGGLSNWTAIGPNGLNSWYWSFTNFAGGEEPELSFDGGFSTFNGMSYFRLILD